MNSKSILSPFFAVASALCLLTQPLLADTFGLFTYADNGSSITITDYQESATGGVAIPATIFNKPVKAIGEEAFSQLYRADQCYHPTHRYLYRSRCVLPVVPPDHVTIPSSVTTIGDSAFYCCAA